MNTTEKVVKTMLTLIDNIWLKSKSIKRSPNSPLGTCKINDPDYMETASTREKTEKSN